MFCKDCKYIRLIDRADIKSALCGHPNNLHRVDGTEYMTCLTARSSSAHCGESAKNFEREKFKND